jgi:nitrite reductase/ring-hydroxylating ferredoxin subunit
LPVQALVIVLIKGADPVKVAVAPLNVIPGNGPHGFELNGGSVLVARTAAGVFAPANRCSHAREVLEGGTVQGVSIFCLAHGMRSDMRDGSPGGTPTEMPVAVWKTETIDGIVHIDMEGA